ncbi:MAG: hypothetical protein ACR2PL_23495 [Dehalococcoidia bacterium]
MATRIRAGILGSAAILFVVCIVFGAGPARLSSQARVAQAQTAPGSLDRVAIVQQFADSINQGDVEGSLAFLNPAAIFADNVTCPLESPCKGIASIRSISADSSKTRNGQRGAIR